MKKKLFYLVVFLLPLHSFAQNETEVIKNFESGVAGVLKTFPVNDHVNIMQVVKNADEFDLIAINDQMQVLWKTTLKGLALSAAKFKDAIVAVSATGSDSRGTSNTFTGYMVDMATGKVIIEKEIFHDQDKFNDQTLFITDPKGEFFKIAVRQTGLERKRFTVIFFNKISDKITKDFTLLDFNQQLQPSIIKPVLTDGFFAGMTSNRHGDLFLCWLKPNNTLSMVKYEAGKQNPEGVTGKDMDLGISDNKKGTEYTYRLFSSSTEPNVVYFNMMYQNKAHTKELDLGKYDFLAGNHIFVKSELSRDHNLDDLEKSTISEKSNKNDRPSFGSAADMDVKFNEEKNGNVVIALSGTHPESGMTNWFVENSLLINVYDKNLQLKYQAALPSGYQSPSMKFSTGIRLDNNYFYTIANQKQGFTKITTIYGRFNLATGKWENMDWLDQKKIGNYCSVGACAMWFANCLILPYAEVGSSFSGKVDIHIQKYLYSQSIN